MEWGRMLNVRLGKGGVVVYAPQAIKNQQIVSEFYLGNYWLQVS